MSEKELERFKSLVNASAYLQRLAVEEEFRKFCSQREMEYVTHDRPWKEETLKKEGFIDIVAGYGIVRFVVECKHPRSGGWIFLIHDNKQETQRTRCHWVSYRNSSEDISGFDDFEIEPKSLESDACIIDSESDNGRTQIGHTADNLLASAEHFAMEELLFLHNKQWKLSWPLVFIPVIVTTAHLYACVVDRRKISLTNAAVSEDNFQSVPMIRYRRNFSAKLISDHKPQSVAEAIKNRERSIIVMNTSHLSELLSQWNLRGPSFSGRFPWDSTQ
jgi:hypothetical protein